MISHVALEQQIASDLLAAESITDLEQSDAASDRAYSAQHLALTTAAHTADDLSAKKRILLAELADRIGATNDLQELEAMIDSLVAGATRLSA